MLLFRRHTMHVVLLAVFLGGGLFAPLVHRAHHGLAWAERRGGAGAVHACDHSLHGAGLESALPFVEVEQCPLCLRLFVPFEGPHVGFVAVFDFAAYVPLEQQLPALPPADRYAIRGPPTSA